MAPHGEATWFTPAPRHLLLGPGASTTLSKAAQAGASSGSQPPWDSRAPRSSWPVSCSPGGAAEQLGPRTGAGRGGALAPGPGVFIGMWSGASRKPSGRPALGKWIAN